MRVFLILRFYFLRLLLLPVLLFVVFAEIIDDEDIRPLPTPIHSFSSCVNYGGRPLSVVTSNTVHRFEMVVRNPEDDEAVSAELIKGGMFDAHVMAALQYVLQETPCNSSSFFVDVGANLGFFSFFASSMHCDVLMFEPQAHAKMCIEASICMRQGMNGSSIQFVNSPVSLTPTMRFPTFEREYGNPGLLGFSWCVKKDHQCESRKTARLDSILGLNDAESHDGHAYKALHGRHIRLMKIDVEGFEADVLSTAQHLLRRDLVENILFELTPFDMGLKKNVDMLLMLVENGFFLAELPFFAWKYVRDRRRPFYSKVLPFTNVSEAHLTAFTQSLIDGESVPKHRGHFQTDIWATKDAGIFARYNAIVTYE